MMAFSSWLTYFSVTLIGVPGGYVTVIEIEPFCTAGTKSKLIGPRIGSRIASTTGTAKVVTVIQNPRPVAASHWPIIRTPFTVPSTANDAARRRNDLRPARDQRTASRFDGTDLRTSHPPACHTAANTRKMTLTAIVVVPAPVANVSALTTSTTHRYTTNSP